MKKRKKIISLVIKLLVGFLSALVIYTKLESGFSTENFQLIKQQMTSINGILLMLLCLLLVPVNWGIEAYKWQRITHSIEQVSYSKASKSIYGGVCVGNLAPGRSTEFIAKIFFFKPENRSKITVLHFIGGLFQFSITIFIGLAALIYKINDFGSSYSWMIYVISGLGTALIILLVLASLNIEKILHVVSKKFSKQNNFSTFEYKLNKKLVTTLIYFSVVRYLAFFTQLSLLLFLFSQQPFTLVTLTAIALYFLVTSLVPMISFLEAAIRSAIALVVFKNTGINNTSVALSVIVLWILNIVIPTCVGYYFLWKEQFKFKLKSN